MILRGLLAARFGYTPDAATAGLRPPMQVYPHIPWLSCDPSLPTPPHPPRSLLVPSSPPYHFVFAFDSLFIKARAITFLSVFPFGSKPIKLGYKSHLTSARSPAPDVSLSRCLRSAPCQ